MNLLCFIRNWYPTVPSPSVNWPDGLPNRLPSRKARYWVLYYLAHGYRVELGTIGTATATLKADRTVYKEEGIHAQSIRFDKVKIQVSKGFSRRCQGDLVRAPLAFKFGASSSELNEEARFGLLQQYLKEHTFISRTTYGELTGLLKTKAWSDLNRWVKEGRLVTRGRAPHKVYLLAT